MDITLPAIPAGVLVLLGLVAPYAVALVNHKGWSTSVKRIVSVAVSIILAAVVLAFYYAYTREPIPDWPVLVLLFVVVVQASYALFTRSSAERVEAATDPTYIPGQSLRNDLKE